MPPPLTIRNMGVKDFASADSLRSLSSWNQTHADWARFLYISPETCFIAEINGQVVGTATLTLYGITLAWVGMMLVHPEYRRQGIGKRLLEHCLAQSRQRGVRTVVLAATPAGKQLYDSLGFVQQYTLSRWAGRSAIACSGSLPTGMAEWHETDSVHVERLDTEAFGVSRSAMRDALAADSISKRVLRSPSNQIEGYGFLREGADAAYLGPVVARTAEAGIELLEALLERSNAENVYLDSPDANSAAAHWAQKRGFSIQRPLIQMFVGASPPPGNPEMQFGLAGPEVG